MWSSFVWWLQRNFFTGKKWFSCFICFLNKLSLFHDAQPLTYKCLDVTRAVWPWVVKTAHKTDMQTHSHNKCVSEYISDVLAWWLLECSYHYCHYHHNLSFRFVCVDLSNALALRHCTWLSRGWAHTVKGRKHTHTAHTQSVLDKAVYSIHTVCDVSVTETRVDIKCMIKTQGSAKASPLYLDGFVETNMDLCL